MFDNIASPTYGSADTNRVVLVGQSAGGAHVATNLYSGGDPSLNSFSSSTSTSTSNGAANTQKSKDIQPPLKGVAYLSVPFYFDHTKARRAQTLREYYGSDQVNEWEPRSPLGLFKRLQEDDNALKALELPVLICLGQLDP